MNSGTKPIWMYPAFAWNSAALMIRIPKNSLGILKPAAKNLLATGMANLNSTFRKTFSSSVLTSPMVLDLTSMVLIVNLMI